MKFRFVMKKILFPLVFMIKCILIHKYQQKITRVNTSPTRINKNQHNSDTSQHESTRVRQESPHVGHESTQV